MEIVGWVDGSVGVTVASSVEEGCAGIEVATILKSRQKLNAISI